MPPASRRRRPTTPCWDAFRKQVVHHVIFYGRDGITTRGCAHCPYVLGQHPVEDRDLQARQNAESLAQHRRFCRKPVK